MQRIAKILHLEEFKMVKIDCYEGEPKLYHYVARCRRGSELCVGKAFSYKSDDARLRAVGEMLERYCLRDAGPTIARGSFEQVRKSHSAVDPRYFRCFTDQQLRKWSFKKFRFSEHTTFEWVGGFGLHDSKYTLVPRQLIETSNVRPQEAFIRFPTSLGAAGGFSLSTAILRGIMEVVEKDALMIRYLCGMPARRIRFETLPKSIAKLILRLGEYHLYAKLFDAALDIPVPTIVAVIEDNRDSPLFSRLGQRPQRLPKARQLVH